jgi:serine protease DegQ
MKRNPLYGGSGLSGPVRWTGPAAAPSARSEDAGMAQPLTTARPRLALKTPGRRTLLVAGLGAVVAAVVAYSAIHRPRSLTQADIDAAVAYALKHRPAEPAPASVAAEVVRPSVVRVVGYALEGTAPGRSKPGQEPVSVAPEQGAPPMPPDAEQGAISVGSGVVIDERGTILTNWHVAASAPRLKVTFANGLESDADIVGAQAQDDLAVIRARITPDDLKPATLVSTGGLKPGDEVVAVGFPFAIGPSVTEGVVSGLKREWSLPGGRHIGNLIQFDAAANPGNSGGPLVNRNGEVLGIVTGILNPTKQHVFIGIGFAVPIENAAAAAGMSPF